MSITILNLYLSYLLESPNRIIANLQHYAFSLSYHFRSSLTIHCILKSFLVWGGRRGWGILYLGTLCHTLGLRCQRVGVDVVVVVVAVIVLSDCSFLRATSEEDDRPTLLLLGSGPVATAVAVRPWDLLVEQTPFVVSQVLLALGDIEIVLV